MKHLRIRISALLLALLMAISTITLVACADDPAEEKQPEQENTPTENEQPSDDPEDPRLPLELPTATYGGKEIHFLSYSAEGETAVGTIWIPWEEIDVEDYAGGTLEGVVYDRNATVEELYDVKITNEYISVDQGYSNTFRANHNSGEDRFQVATQRSYEIRALVMENLMSNMFELSNLHTDMPWWNQDSVRSFTLGSTLFFAAPELLLRDKGATAVMFYNATVANNKGVTNLYEMAEEGTWTFEQFISLCEEVAASMDGDDLMNSGEDLWGSGMSNDAIFYLFGGSGMKFASVDDDGYVEYQFGSEQSILYLQDIFDYAVYTDALAHPNVVDLNGVNIFRNDCSLFAFGLVKDVLGLRSMESDFGVLPIPKMDEYQKDYASLVWVHHDAVLGIPSIVGDPEMVSVVLEHMSYLSYYDIYPVFYDTVILGKSTRDQQSKEMLELIFQTRAFDPGQYWLATSTGPFLVLFEQKKTNISSVWAAAIKQVEAELEAFNEKIDEVN